MNRFKRLKKWFFKEALNRQRICVVNILKYSKLLVKTLYVTILHPSGIEEGLNIIVDCLAGIIVSVWFFTWNIIKSVWWIIYYSIFGFKGVKDEK